MSLCGCRAAAAAHAAAATAPTCSPWPPQRRRELRCCCVKHGPPVDAGRGGTKATRQTTQRRPRGASTRTTVFRTARHSSAGVPLVGAPQQGPPPRQPASRTHGGGRPRGHCRQCPPGRTAATTSNAPSPCSGVAALPSLSTTPRHPLSMAEKPATRARTAASPGRGGVPHACRALCWAATTGTRPQPPSDCRPSRRSTVPQRWGPATPFLRRFRAAVHQPTRHAPPRHTRHWTPRSKRQRATGPAGQYVSEESCGGAPPLSRGARESHRGNSECRSVVPDHVRGPNSPSAQQSTGKEGREQPRTSTAPRWWCHLLHMRQMPTWVQRKKKLGKQQD